MTNALESEELKKARAAGFTEGGRFTLSVVLELLNKTSSTSALAPEFDDLFQKVRARIRKLSPSRN